MKKHNIKTILSIITNFFLFFMVVISWIVMMFTQGDIKAFAASGLNSLLFYTVLSNILLGIDGLICGIFEILRLKNGKEIPLGITLLNYVSLVGVSITFITVVFYLGPVTVNAGNNYFSMFEGSNFFFHFFHPVLAMINFFIFENNPLKFHDTFLGLITPILYGIFYFLNVTNRWISASYPVQSYDWYGFYGEGTPLHIILFLLIFFSLVYLLCLLLYFINKLVMKHKNVIQG